jgi:hypothetical protein
VIRAGSVLALVALAGCPKARENESADQRDRDCPFPRQDQVPANGIMLTTSGVSGGSYVVFDADARSLRFREWSSYGCDGAEQTRVLAPERAAALYALALRADAANNWTAPESPDWGLSLTIAKGAKRRQIAKNGEFTEGPAKQLLAELNTAAGVHW